MSKLCLICGEATRRERGAQTCWACSLWLQSRQSVAMRAVKRSVRAGSLPPVRTLQCVDCGAQARDYEHRDYDRPLDVVATCRSCNLKRKGAAQVSPAFKEEAVRVGSALLAESQRAMKARLLSKRRAVWPF